MKSLVCEQYRFQIGGMLKIITDESCFASFMAVVVNQWFTKQFPWFTDKFEQYFYLYMVHLPATVSYKIVMNKVY